MESRTLAHRYRLEGPIGRGGMGIVHRATDLELGRRVAVKLVAEDGDAQSQARFVREAKRTANVRHPHVVEVFDVGEDAGEVFLVMELLEGESLATFLGRAARFDVAEVVTLGGQICDALAAAHDAGIVHRDLKPANVFLVRPSDADSLPRVKLLDFGIAKRIDGSTSKTDADALVGTMAYMSPEQIRSEPLDGRSDLYAFGLLLFRLLAGRPPFAADNVAALLRCHLEVAPPSLRATAPEARVPASLDALVRRLLAKEPARRPANARDAKRLLLATLTEPPPTHEGMREITLDEGAAPAAWLELAEPKAASGGAPAVVPPPLAPLRVETPAARAAPAWLAPLMVVPESVTKRVAAYSLVALSIDVVFFGRETAVVIVLVLLAVVGTIATLLHRRIA